MSESRTLTHDPVERALGRHWLALDGYRAIAVLMVVITHVAFVTGTYSNGPWGHLLSRFDFGVTLFFVLSGYLLYSPWARAAIRGVRGPRIPGYAWRRLLRIVPAYAIVVVVVICLLPQAQANRSPTSIPIHLFFLQTYVPGALVEGLTQTWSLVTEMAFYIVLPVLAWVLSRRSAGHAQASARWQLQVLGVLTVVALLWNIARTVEPFSTIPGAGFWLPGHLDWFALGMAAAIVRELVLAGHDSPAVKVVHRIASDTVTCVVCALCLLLIASTPVGGSYSLEPGTTWTVVVRHVLYGAAAAFLLLPALIAPDAQSRWLRGLSSPVMVYFGRISYGIFLWHLAIMWACLNVLHWTPFSGGFIALLALTVAVSVLVASVSWYLVERPILQLKGRVRS